MSDEPDPPRKNYQFKPREFERVNDHPGHAAPDSDPAIRPERIDVRDHFKVADASPPPVSVSRAKDTDNDVQAILRDNLARANAAGLNDLAPQVLRRSRRKRDYWLVLIPVDAFFTFVLLHPSMSGSMKIYALAGLVMFTLGFSWVMWFVVDDY